MNEHRGLCISCRNALTCTFLRGSHEAVLQCDEFDGFESFLREPKQCSHQNIMDFKSNSKNRGLDGYKGLCAICENLKTCTYPKPEGGVWHCEEYR
jgi:hypothetical protein